jgi:xanthine dehydrogenase iron-sulfur cluster and FAD-binding subunit A
MLTKEYQMDVRRSETCETMQAEDASGLCADFFTTRLRKAALRTKHLLSRDCQEALLAELCRVCGESPVTQMGLKIREKRPTAQSDPQTTPSAL